MHPSAGVLGQDAGSYVHPLSNLAEPLEGVHTSVWFPDTKQTTKKFEAGKPVWSVASLVDQPSTMAPTHRQCKPPTGTPGVGHSQRRCRGHQRICHWWVNQLPIRLQLLRPKLYVYGV